MIMICPCATARVRVTRTGRRVYPPRVRVRVAELDTRDPRYQLNHKNSFRHQTAAISATNPRVTRTRTRGYGYTATAGTVALAFLLNSLAYKDTKSHGLICDDGYLAGTTCGADPELSVITRSREGLQMAGIVWHKRSQPRVHHLIQSRGSALAPLWIVYHLTEASGEGETGGTPQDLEKGGAEENGGNHRSSESKNEE
ncbi:hypothetical protein FB45DRAFT_875442 [Roridomyces roridus]|uniref:Uncharacterized protein n=1 Tax=Roridomyces roridus TaxID=1738132 RepID=A0AAD7FBZ9_9AGAR|nr:hypothetical protein FB45DRAFT_875442 [Roridomyces roridus]